MNSMYTLRLCTLLVAVTMLTVACGDDPATATPDASSMDMSRAQGDMRARDMPRDEADSSIAPTQDQDVPRRDMPATSPDMMGDMGSPSDQGSGRDADMPSEQDMSDAADMEMVEDMTPPVDMAMMPDVYVGAGDVFVPGPLQVSKGSATVAGGIALSVWSPSMAGDYAVIVFQHGFLLSTAYYDTLLTHIASHGFIIAAPQMYAPGDNPLGKPSSAEEAASALGIWQNLGATLPAALPAGVGARLDRLGLIGHSRGSKVVWLNLVQQPTIARAAVGLDPVDGTGGGFTSEPRAIPASGLTFSIPSLFVGTGLGPNGGGLFSPACAPEADGYKSFFAGAQAPAYELVATEYGHLDMLEDQPAGCGFSCQACDDGAGPRDLMRRASAGWTVALMREALQGSVDAANVLSNPALAPVTATLRSK